MVRLFSRANSKPVIIFPWNTVLLHIITRSQIASRIHDETKTVYIMRSFDLPDIRLQPVITQYVMLMKHYDGMSTESHPTANVQ